MGKSLRIVDIPAPAHVEALTRAGLPRPFAEAVAELNACFASGRIKPHGDRTDHGTTTLEEVLPDLVAGIREAAVSIEAGRDGLTGLPLNE